jgi:hypothetical protein
MCLSTSRGFGTRPEPHTYEMQANSGLVVGSSEGSGPIRCHARPSMCRTGVALRSPSVKASVSRYSSIGGIQSSNESGWVCFDHHCVLDQHDLSLRRLCESAQGTEKYEIFVCCKTRLGLAAKNVTRASPKTRQCYVYSCLRA